jgi:acyl-CoA thioesterase FadM
MKGDPFESIVNVFACQVQWGDCDPAGIIFYPT